MFEDDKSTLDTESLIQEFVENDLKNIDSALDFYLNDFGQEQLYDIIDNNWEEIFDLDELIFDAVEWDGVAHFLATYDEKELDLGNDLYAYRIN